MRQAPWQKVRFAILTWLDSWPPLQRSESWRENTLLAEVEERPDPFHWAGGIPQRRKDLILARLTGHGLPWEAGNWIAKWISEPQP